MLRTLTRRSALGLMSLPLVSTALAQDLTWQIPRFGVVEYERKTLETYVGVPSRGRGVTRVIALGREGGNKGGHDWLYVLGSKASPAPGWQRPKFDDTYWTAGRSGFGQLKDKRNKTAWKSPWIHARATFEVGRTIPKGIRLSIAHDDNATVFLNGVQVYQVDRYTPFAEVMLGTPALKAIKRGTNLIAVACHNTGGAQILDLGLTVYSRKQPSAAVSKAKATRERNAARAVNHSIFPLWRPPTLVFDTDLDANRQVLKQSPADIRDLGWFLATDFQRFLGPFTVNKQLRKVYQLGDVKVRGKAFPIDDTGKQTMQLTFESNEPRAHKGEDKRYIEAQYAPHMRYRLRGTLEIERRLDLKRGLVLAAKVKLKAIINRGKGTREFEVRFAEDYQLKKVRKHRDGQFEEDVVNAIRSGTAAIKKNLAKLNRRELRGEKKGANRSYNSGRLALATLAMIQGGIKKNDPILQAALAEMRKRNFVDTYSLGIACMAFEALYAPIGERSDLKSGLITKPRQRKPSPADYACLERWAKKILNNRDTRVDQAYRLRFNYVRGGRYDHSVNQYGLLGLYSAHLCGVKVSSSHWQAAINHLVEDRQKPRKRAKLELVRHRDFDQVVRPVEASSKRTTTGKRSADISGWGYYGPRNRQGVDNPIYGSMTCAGITGLTICLAGLRDNGVNYAKLMSDADKALRGGFGWLAQNLELRWHPGRATHFYRHVYYYLYGLERACELSGVAMIQGRDWYFEGALIILAQQHKNGHFRNDERSGEIIEDTAMAVLFLKKSSLPVFTGR